MDWTSWHGGLMWIFWVGVLALFTGLGWWGNRRMTERRERERKRRTGEANGEQNDRS